MFRRDGGDVRDFATHIDDFLWRGEQDVLSNTRVVLERRFGNLKVQEFPSARAGAALRQENGIAVKLTREEFASNSRSLALPNASWQGKNKLRQRKSGELCWLDSVPRSDTCARLMRAVSRVNP